MAANSKLLPLPNTNCTWEWNTQDDHADKEAKSEKLAIRFRSAESECLHVGNYAHCKYEVHIQNYHNEHTYQM